MSLVVKAVAVAKEVFWAGGAVLGCFAEFVG